MPFIMQQGETLCSAAPMPALAIALVHDLLGRTPRRECDPEDVDAEYEPEATIRVLESEGLDRMRARPYTCYYDGRLWREHNPL